MPTTQELHEMHLDMQEARAERVKLGALLLSDYELSLLLLYSAGYKHGEACGVVDCQKCVQLGNVWHQLFSALTRDYQESIYGTLGHLDIPLPRRS